MSQLQLILFVGTHGCQTHLICSSGFPSQSKGVQGQYFPPSSNEGFVLLVYMWRTRCEFEVTVLLLFLSSQFFSLLLGKREGLVLKTPMTNLPPALLQGRLLASWGCHASKMRYFQDMVKRFTKEF